MWPSEPAGCWTVVCHSCRSAAGWAGCRRSSCRRSELQQWPTAEWTSLWLSRGCCLLMWTAGRTSHITYPLFSVVLVESADVEELLHKRLKTNVLTPNWIRYGNKTPLNADITQRCYRIAVPEQNMNSYTKPALLCTCLCYLVPEWVGDVESLLLRDAWMSVWTIKDEEDPQDEPH